MEIKNYNKLQKIVSFFLIGMMLFWMSVRIPLEKYMVEQSYASSDTHYKVVSILVDEEVYPKIEDKINRYAKDISLALDNTKTVIIPIPENADTKKIASINEKLYFQWLPDSSFKSSLIWTVLVGNISLPVVYLNDQSEKTILPYTDFINKGFVFNESDNKYVYNYNNTWEIKPEIWHWVISPNSWYKANNIQQLKDFFDKDHDFYALEWNFKEADLKANEPYVFYFDSYKEQNSISYSQYKWYEAYEQNLEDLAYRRYTWELAEKLKKDYEQNSEAQIKELLEKISGKEVKEWALSETPDTDKMWDINSRYVISSIVKKFPEIFNETSLWEIRNTVAWAGRYNANLERINVDMIPAFVGMIDRLTEIVLKDAATDMEKEIDELITKWLSKKIAVPYTVWQEIITYSADPSTPASPSWPAYKSSSSKNTYTNVLHWMRADKLEGTKDCTIYRGSMENGWTLVEANRWYNIQLIQDDVNFLKNSPNSVLRCLATGTPQVNARFGGNSPLNLDEKSYETNNIKLKNHDLTSAILPLYSISWAKEVTDKSKTPSPKQCLENNFLHTYERRSQGEDRPPYIRSVPVNNPSSWGSNWSCTSGYTPKAPAYNDITFEKIMGSATCDMEVKLDWNIIHALTPCPENKDKITWIPKPRIVRYYEFKSIASIMEHKSPTLDEIKNQISNTSVPNLPVDKDRYVDFIAANWDYQKINYPYTFRVFVDKDKDLSIENVRIKLKEELDNKSKEINEIITKSSWSPHASLNTGPYPAPKFDLYQILSSKKENSFKSWTKEKALSYYDTLLFAVYWNNLKSASAKYDYVFKTYLNDTVDSSVNPSTGVKNSLKAILDGTSSTEDKVPLPWAKRTYEVAYLKASGTSQNMFVNVDPEEKNVAPIASVRSSNAKLNNYMMSANRNTATLSWGKSNNKCAPPDGVSIFEWFPAVLCRLGDLMDTDSFIGPWNCWGQELWKDEDAKNLWGRLPEGECERDANKNQIKDCIEAFDTIVVSWDEAAVYNETLPYNVSTNYKWVINVNDNKSVFTVEIQRIEKQKNIAQPISDTNKEVIYLKWQDEEIIKDYVVLPEKPIRVENWKAVVNIITKNTESYVYFKIKSVLPVPPWSPVIVRYSEQRKLTISGTKMMASSYRVSNMEGLVLKNSTDNAVVSEEKNLFLYDKNDYRLSDNLNQVDSFSLSPDKMLLGVTSVADSWARWNINYPLTLDILDEDSNKVNSESIVIKEGQIDSPASLWSISKAWSYTIKLEDSKGLKEAEVIKFMPEKVATINTFSSTDILEVWWVEIKDIVELRDEYKNLVAGKLYDVELTIEWDSIVFSDGTKKMNISTIEWFKAVDIKSTNKTGTSKIIYKIKWKAENGFNITSSWDDIVVSKDLEVVESIDFDVEFPDEMEVWWKTYEYTVKINDSDKFNSVAFVSFDWIYWSGWDYFKIKDSIWKSTFTTTNVAKQDAIIKFKVAWIKKEIQKKVVINPLKPMKVDYILEKSVLNADNNTSTKLYVTLRDIFWNAVFTDNSTEVKFSIYDWYSAIIKAKSDRERVVQGKAEFILNSTNIPGTAFFKVSTVPSISMNTYNLTWTDWEIIKVNWVWENAWYIKTWYFWTADKIRSMNYNALYTTLIWWAYWDISQKDYLASWIIFDKDNKGLVVTTLLNNPKDYPEVFNVAPHWNLEISDSPNLTQNIEKTLHYWTGEYTKINLFNKSLNKFVWEVVYNFSDNSEFKKCDKLDEKSCYKYTDENKKDYIYYKLENSDYKIISEPERLVLKNKEDNEIVSINKQAKIENIDKNHKIVISPDNNSDNLELDILDTKWMTIAKVILSNYWSVKITREQSYSTFSWDVVVYIESSSYWATSKYYGNDNKGLKWISIWHNDDLSTDGTNSFANIYSNGYENIENDWSGWKDENKSLLSFASWETVWEATKEYASFSMINLWDPVVSLDRFKADAITEVKDKKLTERSFDSSIWKLIEEDDTILSYEIFDYNKDNSDDIVVFYDTGFIKLFENNKGEYIDRWNITNVDDINKYSKFATWDLTWDWFDEVVYLNKSWELNLLNNNKKDFVRKNLKDSLILNWRITDFEIFDMDNDKKDDIVTLDDAWEINIFYSKSTEDTPVFVKNFVQDGMWVILNTKETNSLSAIYHAGLKQLEDTKNASSSSMDEAIDETKENISSLVDKINSGYSSPTWPQEKQKTEASDFDKFLFYQFYFTPESKKKEIPEWEEKTTKTVVTESITTLDWVTKQTTEKIQEGFALLDEKASSTGSTINYTWEVNSLATTTFLKWEYAEKEGLKITKTYEDVNKSPLQSGNIVKVKIILEDLESQNLKDVIYLEDIPYYLDKTDSFKVLVNGKEHKIESVPAPARDFDFMLRLWDLKSGEKITIEYETKAKSFETYEIKAWLFESGETWDDPYWDILCTKADRSCWEPETLLRSTSEKEYEEGKTLLTCESQPSVVSMFKTDSDTNGIPDFMDAELKSANILKSTWNFDLSDKVKADYNEDVNNNDVPDFIDNIVDYGWQSIENFNEDLNANSIPDFIDELINTGQLVIDDYKKDEDNNGVSDFLDDLTKLASDVIEDFGKDENNNWVSDFTDWLIALWQAKFTKEQLQTFLEDNITKIKNDINWNGLEHDDDELSVWDRIQKEVDKSWVLKSEIEWWVATVELGLHDVTSEISDEMDRIIDWFGCWFGWNCLDLPLNRAPLAPWNDPTGFLGKPLWDWLHVKEWLPIFAYPTIGPVKIAWVPTPPFRPTNYDWAGWLFGVSTSTFRLFVTPTLTGSTWIAVCTGNNMINWNMPPPWVSPMMSGWNCVVAAGLWSFCSALEEENNAGVSSTWSAQSRCSEFSIFNWNCKSKVNLNNIKLPNDLVSSLLWQDKDKVDYSLYEDFIRNIWSSWDFTWEDLFDWLITWGWEWTDVNLTYDKENWLWVNIPDNIKNLRISSFPSFFMGWFEKQVEEIINKITDFPKLFIILPDVDWFTDKMKESYNIKNFKDKFGKKKKEWDKEIKRLKNQIASINSKLATLERTTWIWTWEINRETGAIVSETWPAKDEQTWSIKSLELSSKWLFENVQDIADGQDWARKEAENEDYVDGQKEANEKIAAELRQERDKLETELALRENEYVWETVTSVKAAYEIISKLPLLQIDEDTIDVVIPWISPAMLEEAIIRWKLTLAQRKNEVQDKVRKYSLWKAGCDKLDPSEVPACKETFDVWLDLATNASDTIDSIEENIEILESYRDIPEAVYDYMKKKEERLDQILCNVKIVSDMLWGFIKRNWKMFKTWVELFILLKWLLKSWQALIDIFLWYEQECRECKNERFDLVNFIFGLILPTPPIIRFPKWPDIILDLHNIKWGITILLPNFDFTTEPIVLPDLPELRLPEVWNLNLGLDIELPDIPLLPELELPTLPDLPSFPEILLPNLPPAPKVPDLFSGLQVFADIIQLITKAMCMLKRTPFVPEWRAWDHIAFLTERQGYMALDFAIDLSFPDFAMSFIDAIEVGAYVNLEYALDQYLESIKQTFEENVNTFATDIKSSLEGQLPDIDFSQLTPWDFEFNVWISKEGTESSWTSPVINTDWLDIWADANATKERILNKSWAIKDVFGKLFAKADIASNKEITVEQLRLEAQKILENPKFNSDPRYNKMLSVLEKSVNYDFAKEDKFINKLEKFNKEKYDTLSQIIETEISINKAEMNELREKLNKLKEEKLPEEKQDDAEFISNNKDDLSTRISGYNKLLDKYNGDLFEENNENYYEHQDALEKEKQVLDKKVERFNDKVRTLAGNLDKASSNATAIINSTRVMTAAPAVDDNISTTTSTPDSSSTSTAVTTTPDTTSTPADSSTTEFSSTTSTPASTETTESKTESESWSGTKVWIDPSKAKIQSCTQSSGWGWTYTPNYKGLYVNENGKNYRLFEYLDEVNWSETTKITDFDNDGDEDLVYKLWTQIFLKENLSNDDKEKQAFTPRKMSYDSGYFADTRWYAPAVNGFEESVLSDGQINFHFDASTDEKQNNYRIEYYSIIDRFGIEEKALSKYGKRWNIVDAISDIDNTTVRETKDNYVLRNNIATLDLVWSTTWVYIETPELLKVNDNINAWQKVNLSSHTKLYAGKTNAVIKYKILEEEKTLLIPAWANIEFNYWVEIFDVTYGQVYVEGRNKAKYMWDKIIELVGLPLLPWTQIKSLDNLTQIYNESNHIDIKYYDNSKLYLDFRNYKLYNLVDLGEKNDTYFVILDAKNDLYYAKVKNFGYQIKSTYGNTVVLSPQKENDKSVPVIKLSNIRIPIYKEINFDFTPYIEDESGINSIKEIYLDTDLEKDADLDWNNENDKDIILWVDTDKHYKISKDEDKFILTAGNFETLFEKDIKMFVVDYNDNVWDVVIKISSYSPTPDVEQTKKWELDWEISETLKNQPVTLFRYRLWSLEKVNSEAIETDENWEFKYSYNTEKWLEIKVDDKVIAQVDEKTWFIEFISSDYNLEKNIKVIMPEDKEKLNNYPLITLHIDNEDIYESYFVLPDTGEVNLVNNLDTDSKPWTYTVLLDQNNYGTYSVPANAKYNPWAVVIYSNTDSKKEPLFVVYRDWRITAKNSNYTLSVEELNKHFVYKLQYKNNVVAKVLLQVEDNFIINK